MKKLYKSNNRMICGVCAGIAEYLGIDPTVVRLIWAALGLTGTGSPEAARPGKPRRSRPPSNRPPAPRGPHPSLRRNRVRTQNAQ